MAKTSVVILMTSLLMGAHAWTAAKEAALALAGVVHLNVSSVDDMVARGALLVMFHCP